MYMMLRLSKSSLGSEMGTFFKYSFKKAFPNGYLGFRMTPNSTFER